MHTYIHTHIHTHIHTYIHIHAHIPRPTQFIHYTYIYIELPVSTIIYQPLLQETFGGARELLLTTNTLVSPSMTTRALHNSNEKSIPKRLLVQSVAGVNTADQKTSRRRR